MATGAAILIFYVIPCSDPIPRRINIIWIPAQDRNDTTSRLIIKLITMNEQQPQQSQQQVQVKITDDVLKGVYANMAQVAHTPEEFVMDFMNLMGGAGIVTSRVIVSPQHMKRIVAALQDNIKRYEEQFGQIKAGSDLQPHIGFRTE